MDNFDLKKFLKESKALENLNPSIKSINEGEAIEKKKMTKEAMKKQIKDMIVAELAEDTAAAEDVKLTDPLFEGDPGEEESDRMEAGADGMFLEEGTAVAPDNRVDFLENVLIEVWGKGNDGINVWFRAMAKDLANSLFDDRSHELEEAKKKKDEEEVEDVEDVEVTDTEEMPADGTEMPAEDAPEATGGIEDLAADMKGTEADLMDHLMKAFQIAKGMNNEKLETQVGNTLKFFVSEYIGGGEN
jgi:hypothetical protein